MLPIYAIKGRRIRGKFEKFRGLRFVNKKVVWGAQRKSHGLLCRHSTPDTRQSTIVIMQSPCNKKKTNLLGKSQLKPSSLLSGWSQRVQYGFVILIKAQKATHIFKKSQFPVSVSPDITMSAVVGLQWAFIRRISSICDEKLQWFWKCVCIKLQFPCPLLFS